MILSLRQVERHALSKGKVRRDACRRTDSRTVNDLGEFGYGFLYVRESTVVSVRGLKWKVPEVKSEARVKTGHGKPGHGRDTHVGTKGGDDPPEVGEGAGWTVVRRGERGSSRGRLSV